MITKERSMAAKIRIGVLGLTHDHVWGNLGDLATSSDGELIAAADPHPELRGYFEKQHGRATYASAEELLERHALDAVYIFGDNAGGVDLACMAAARGLHLMIEKPLASTFAGAAKIRGAARQAGVQLMVNWPIAWWAAVQRALDMATSGELGEIFQINYRSAHAGPRELGCSPFFAEWLYDPARNGAGALMDYCCYGAALTCAVLGPPARVTGVSGRLRKHDLPAEDNAVVIMQHARAISTATASWTQSGHMTSYEPMFYGSAGTAVVRGDGQELWLANEQHMGGVRIDVDPLPADAATATAFFLSHIRSGAPITGLCGPDVGLMAQEVLEAGIRSAAEGRAISLPLPVAHLV
jgi:predicted dehydrogenase